MPSRLGPAGCARRRLVPLGSPGGWVPLGAPDGASSAGCRRRRVFALQVFALQVFALQVFALQVFAPPGVRAGADAVASRPDDASHKGFSFRPGAEGLRPSSRRIASQQLTNPREAEEPCHATGWTRQAGSDSIRAATTYSFAAPCARLASIVLPSVTDNTRRAWSHRTREWKACHPAMPRFCVGHIAVWAGG